MYRLFTSFLLLGLLLNGCSKQRPHPTQHYETLTERLATGDLLFRRGTGFAGQMVTAIDNEGRFSHAGIVVKEAGEWHVVHAVPYEPEFKGDFDRVKCEPLIRFLGRYPEAEFGHFRATIDRELIARVAEHALRLSRQKIPFDHDYNLEDTTRLYCTELIEYLYGLVGYSLSEGRRTEVHFPSLSGEYIFPSDLTQSNLLTPIY